MNLNEVNERVLFLEKTARNPPPGTVNIDKVVFERLRGEN